MNKMKEVKKCVIKLLPFIGFFLGMKYYVLSEGWVAIVSLVISYLFFYALIELHLLERENR